MPAPSEFYVPLAATGGQYRVELGARRARQLQPLVRQPPDAPGHTRRSPES